MYVEVKTLEVITVEMAHVQLKFSPFISQIRISDVIHS